MRALMSRSRWTARRSALLLMLVLPPAFGLTACGGADSSNSITVLGTWTGEEEKGFLAMIDGFEKTTGLSVTYIGTRDADAVLASGLKNGNPPELAVLASPGELREQAAAGTLVSLDRALDRKQLVNDYKPTWLDLMQAKGPSGQPHFYAIIVKAALKSAIWYSPRNLPPDARRMLTSPKLTWDRLNTLIEQLTATGRSPWCMGMEDTSNSGWPATDWVEDIVLHHAGRDTYDGWVAGTVPWTSPPIRRAWETFGRVIRSRPTGRGALRSLLLTNFGSAGQPMFERPPGCFLEHQGSFITGFYARHELRSAAAAKTHPQPGKDFDFVRFPPLSPGSERADQVAGDLLAMFRDTPEARRLIAYLATPKAQAAWIRRPGSTAISASHRVPSRLYPDPVSRRVATALTEANEVRFDASDSMPPVMAAAFSRAVLEYVSDPSRLNHLLRQLDTVRTAGAG